MGCFKNLSRSDEKLLFWARLVSYLILLELPPFVALYYNRKHALDSPSPNVILWWLGLLCMLIIFAFLLIIHINRWCLYRRNEWKWPNRNNRT